MVEKKKLLIVDDSEVFGHALRDICKARGYEVKYYSSAVDAMNNIDSEDKIDIALLDLIDEKNADITGLDVAAKIRENNAKSKVIIMSGCSLTELEIVKELLLVKKVDYYVQKPFSFKDIRGMVEAE